QPKKKLLEHAGGRVTCTDDVAAAARGADVLYTDIWVSMGKEAEEARREAELGPYWINESVVKLAKPDALVMHCLPAHRGQESDPGRANKVMRSNRDSGSAVFYRSDKCCKSLARPRFLA